MRKESEWDILNSFIKLFSAPPGRWETEVHLTDAALPLHSISHSISKIYFPRIDAVFIPDSGKDYLIVEAKVVLSIEGLGQLLAYRYLYSKQAGIPPENIRLIAVAAQSPKYVKDLYTEYKIEIYTPDGSRIA